MATRGSTDHAEVGDRVRFNRVRISTALRYLSGRRGVVVDIFDEYEETVLDVALDGDDPENRVICGDYDVTNTSLRRRRADANGRMSPPPRVAGPKKFMGVRIKMESWCLIEEMVRTGFVRSKEEAVNRALDDLGVTFHAQTRLHDERDREAS